MPTKTELYNMALIPYEELELFKLTRSIKDPWVSPAAYWVPTHGDIKAIAAIARFVAEQPTIIDIGCGNAFISHLLAQEIPIIGIDPNQQLLAETPYNHPDLQLKEGTAENASEILQGKPVDVVINSWMPQGVDFSDWLYALKPKAIIFVRDGWGFTGKKTAYKPRNNYYGAAQWGGLATAELAAFFDDVCRDLEPFKPDKHYTVTEATSHPNWERVFRRSKGWIGSIPACNIIDIRFRKDIPSPILPITVEKLQPYPWEADLDHITSRIILRAVPDGMSLHPPLIVES